MPIECLAYSSLQVHEFDDVRFDIRAHDCTYFFRASTPEEKQTWIEVIEANKVCEASLSISISV